MFNQNQRSAYVSLMLANRVVISLPRKSVNSGFLASFFYTEASDGLYVPTCDVKQYNSGGRRIAGYGLNAGYSHVWA